MILSNSDLVAVTSCSTLYNFAVYISVLFFLFDVGYPSSISQPNPSLDNIWIMFHSFMLPQRIKSCVLKSTPTVTCCNCSKC